MARSIAGLAALAALLVVPASAGQPLPVEAQTELTVTVGTLGEDIALGSSANVTVDVSLSINNIVCTAEATPEVDLGVVDVPTGVTGISATLDPTSVALDPIPAGPVTSAYTGIGTAILTVTVAATAPADHAHTFNVTGAFAGSSLTGCQGVTQDGPGIPDADGAGSLDISTGAAPTPTVPTGATPTGATPTAPKAKKDSPGLEMVALMASLALVAVVLRRR